MRRRAVCAFPYRGAGSAAPAALPTVLSSTLDAATVQSPISREDMWAWTGAASYGSYSNFTSTSVAQVSDGPDGTPSKVLNQHFPATVSGSTSNYGAPPTGTGITLTSAPLAGGNVEEATIEYDFRAKSTGVPWGWGGKLPGLGGLKAGASGGVPTGGQPSVNGWSARLMFRRQGSDTTNLAARLVGYVYDPTQQAGAIGQDRSTGQLLNRGQWYRLKQYHRMNSINVEGSSGNADGIHRIWLDGVLVYENLAQIYRVHASYGINYLCWDNFYGGNDASDGAPWGPTSDTDLQFDNLVIAGAATAGASPITAATMPTTEPTGFTRVFAEDFTTAAALGSFTPGASGSATDGRLPSSHPYYNRIKCYPDNFGYPGDLGNGRYYSSKVFSALTGVTGANGVLDTYLHSETVDGATRFLSGWFVPFIAGRSQYWTYGRFSIRMRADAVAGGGGVHLLIPDNWPQKGEDDWPEGPFTESPVHGFNHYADPAATANTSGSYQQQVSGLTGSTWQDWHTYTIEWTPGRKRWLMDGVVYLDTTDRVSDAPQKYVPFQSGINGSSIPAAGASGHVQIDWITVADWNG